MTKRQYYYEYDFYNMKSDEQLTIISHFKTRQWTIDKACGANATLMVINYYNDYEMTEEEVFNDIKTLDGHGAKIDHIVSFLRNKGYNVETSIEMQKDIDTGKVFATMESFRDFVINNLKNGFPIIVESVYYGGHYQVIIGYDRQSEDSFLNDIIIFADSSDETDWFKDGYHYLSAFKFYMMWFDDRFFLPKHREQPYIVVKGRN